MNPRLPIRQAAQILEAGIPYGPRTHPCVCGAGRHAHTGRHRTGGCKDTGCARYRAHPAWQLAYRALDAQQTTLGHSLRAYDARERETKRKANPRGRGEWSIGPSDAGTCRKAIEYRNRPPEDFVPSVVDNREARIGSIIHKEVVRELAALYPWRLHEQEVRVAGLDRPAYYDEYDPITAEVHDVKTAGDWRWDQIDAFGPEDEVWEQVLLYGLALVETGHEVRTVRLTYLKRCNGHDQTFVRDYDHDAALAARDRLIGWATELDIAEQIGQEPGTVLPRDRSGPSTDALCRRCFAVRHCWGMDGAEAAGRSPESWTVLGPAPVDPEVEWAIEQNVLAKDAYREAEKAKDETAALIEGLEPRRYGSFKIDEQWFGGAPDYKAYAEALLEAASLPEDVRPDLGSIPIPNRRKVPRLIARRVAKSVLDREARIFKHTKRGGAA